MCSPSWPSRLPSSRRTRRATISSLSFAKVQPKNLFIALTALDEKSNQPHLIGGFQFQGPSSDVDQLIAPAKNRLRQQYPAGKADLVNYQGHSLETFDTGDSGNTVASVYAGDRYLLSNDVALLKATLDRLDKRTPAGTPALDKDGDFQAVNAKLPAGYETLIYARWQPFMGRLMALVAASGQTIDEEARTEAEKVRAFGATTKIENGKMRDTVYTLAPGLKQDVAHLQLGSVALTSPATLLYLAEVMRIPKKLDLPGAGGANGAASGPLAVLDSIGQQLAAKGVTLDAVRAALGGEFAFQLDWPAVRAQPTILWSVDVKDAAAAGKLLDGLTSIPLGQSVWEVKPGAGSFPLRVLTLPGIDAVQPALTLTAKNIILGLNPASVQEAVARESANGPNFTQTEAYKTATNEVAKPNYGFSYLDARTLFERVYGVAKPAAIMGAAFMYPQANDYVDLSKLPPAEAISKHLSPTVMSATLDPQGSLVESTGSVTFFQAGATLASASVAAAVPFLGKVGNMFSPGPGSPGAAATPDPGTGPVAPPAPQPGATP